MQFLIRASDLLYDTFVLIRNALVSLFGPRRAYVLLELTGPYPDHRTRDPWWVRQPQTVEDVRRQLAAIRADPRAAGVVITVGDLPAGLASVQSLRGVLADYRARGGRIVAYLPQASTRQYYLASVADAVVMPESGALDIGGAALEVTFLGDALERAGVDGEFEQIAEYKSAVEPFTRRAMSEPMREQFNAILDSVFDDLTGEIAAARRLDPAAVRDAINRAPLSAADARGAGLVDALLYEDQLPEYLAAAGRPAPIVPWRIARRRLRAPFRWRMPGRAVGVVTVRGPIQMGESRPRPPLSLPIGRGETSGHASLIRAIRSVERNPLFGAIVLSIDSPGGSALASDLIWRAVVQAARRKPVVAYFSNVAASGGYYVAAGAHRIVAQAGTLTGSIGVISGKFTVHRLAARAGVHQEILTRGEAAAMNSPFRTFSGEQRRRLRAQAEEIYARFLDRVAEGRRLPREHVQIVARGRVWTGRQAMQHRLVDRLGDFYAALDTAKELMGLSPSRVVPVLIVRPPRAVSIGRRAALGTLNAPDPGVAGADRAAGLAAGLSAAAGGWMSALWECADMLLREAVVALMPWDIRLR